MARKPEQKLRDLVRDTWPGHVAWVEASVGDAGAGTPDAVLSVEGRGIWVEFKVWPGEVSSIQLAWHADAERRGAGCCVLAQMGDYYWVGSAAAYQRIQDGVDVLTSVSLHEGIHICYRLILSRLGIDEVRAGKWLLQNPHQRSDPLQLPTIRRRKRSGSSKIRDAVLVPRTRSPKKG